ncbi:TPA: ead/Ea22-like family protein [Escherichia coli]|nr:ead/Ea22-like family protein [Escherichia coli]MCI3625146.1 ead/Ea22-like family protein [Escherichia coli]WMO31014.1 ead/Ea22-like family protein [Escherichia coli]HAZ7149787.1 ead/Ea22-like family protein [Escherichia coli]HCD1786036.1 ead/Ea22-like family protein [Escherichia coli]HCJ4370290.1 ead/Ea22-like family protein [Escherichia coli]
MSKINYQALREAAEKATWGDWDSYKPHRGARGYKVRLSGQAIAQHVLKNNAEFIAAFNPKVALALLDELERNQQYIKSRDQENEDIALTVGKLRVELEEAKSKLNEQREYYEGVISDGCKRIAELEAREVQLPTRYDLRYGHPINADERQVMIPKENGSWLYLIDLEHALRVADIRIKGE